MNYQTAIVISSRYTPESVSYVVCVCMYVSLTNNLPNGDRLSQHSWKATASDVHSCHPEQHLLSNRQPSDPVTILLNRGLVGLHPLSGCEYHQGQSKWQTSKICKHVKK